jgi:peptide deformylase
MIQKTKVKKSVHTTRTKTKKTLPLPVVLLGKPILRKKAKKVTNPTSTQTQKLVAQMIATCDLSKGVGIAAPQVNIGEQIFIIWQRPLKRRPELKVFGPEAIINPRILGVSKQIKKAYEGCLSIPGILGNVPRHVHVEVEYTNIQGDRIRARFSHFLARIFQHEFDHLQGIVYLDRITGRDIITEKEYINLLAKKHKK